MTGVGEIRERAIVFLLLGWFLLALPARAQVPFGCEEPGALLACLETDRARYAPGETVRFTLTPGEALQPDILNVRYRHLDEVVQEEQLPVSGDAPIGWSWIAPSPDGRGYLIEAALEEGDDVVTTAVDVSSDWERFPRYGFLSTFASDDGTPLPQERIDRVIRRLNRFHINGLQFYDWQYKHHQPLRGTAESPAVGWRDVAGRPVYVETLAAYIDAAHARGMQAMAYNLLFGAYEDAEADGVDLDAWGLYTDPSGGTLDRHDLPEDWVSDILLMNPDDERWREYLFEETEEAFQALPFDGWHIDQLGDRGARYDAAGSRVDLPASYEGFLEAADVAFPGADLVMNAVNQYAQPEIADAAVSFLYTEVWQPYTTFSDLRSIIVQNEAISDGELPTVLAAYVNYELGDDAAFFNTPAVLLADAVIFASGGAHLELGEHMLSREYFPYDALEMTAELERRLIDYYDFLVAYENLLRGPSEAAVVRLDSPEASIRTRQSLGSIWTFARTQQDRSIIQLVNLSDATTPGWRDNQGIQAAPEIIADMSLSFTPTRPVESIWAATPDAAGGVPVEIPFTREGDQVSLTLPHLEYWTMLVVEHHPENVDAETPELLADRKASFVSVYPDPMWAETRISYVLNRAAPVQLRVYDLMGRVVRTLVDGSGHPGHSSVVWNGKSAAGRHLPPGMYFLRLQTGATSTTRTIHLIR